MATTALYRINGGEVLKISLKGQSFADRDAAYFGVLTDPSLPDGNTVRSMTEPIGPMRVLGLAKIAVPATNTVRNATQAEIDAWAAAETADDNAQDAARVADLFANHPQWRKAFKALLKRILAVTNAEATQYNNLRAQILAGTSLSNLQTRVTNNTANLSTYTLAQAVTALLADIDAND